MDVQVSRMGAFVTDVTDNELAKEAAQGNRASFATLIERHYDKVFRLAWRWSGSRERAEDIAQEVCVKLATAIAAFRGDAEFSTWLYRITFTTTTDALRSAQRIVSLAPSNVLMLVDGASGETPESAVLDQELWQAVRALPEQQRDAVLLVYGEDLTHAEAAVIMGCSEKTVSWHLHEAKKRLKITVQAVS
jgi:RNA polymerase sigma-70 factor (ECF subfamily)